MNKKYTFSLPPEVGVIIDNLSKTKKSDFVAQAILNQERTIAQKKALDVLALIKPKTWDTDRDSVQLVQEARDSRSEQILSKTSNKNE